MGALVSRQRPPVTTLPAQLHKHPYLIGWERTLRWRARAGKAIAHRADENAFDFLFALFLSIFHTRDWIVASRPDLSVEISTLYRGSPALGLVRDVANGAKRMETSRYRIDGAASVAREYAGRGQHRFVIPRPGGRNLDCIVLADECIAEIKGFLAANGLLSVN